MTSTLSLIGRLLLALMFIGAGVSKLDALAGTAAFMGSVGLPASTAAAGAVALFEIGAGVLLVLGWQARWAALALAGFTLVASFLFHAYWAMPAEQVMVQQLMFMKNLAVTGGLLMVAALGAGGFSLDARRALPAGLRAATA
jgi:putative oxidoreductase